MVSISLLFGAFSFTYDAGKEVYRCTVQAMHFTMR